MRASHFGLLVAVLAIVPAPTPAADNSLSGDMARLQGRWSAKAGPQRNVSVVLEIDGHDAEFQITTPRGLKFRVKGEVKINESSQPPALDWVNFNGLDEQEIPEIQAIYKLDGDKFQVCNGGPNNGRPTEFKPGDGILADMVVFERVK